MRTSHVAFLGFCQTGADFEAILQRDRAMPVQTQRFGWSVVSAIEAAGGRVSILAAAPASDWPGNKAVFLGGSRSVPQAGGISRRHELLGFVNVIGLKHLTRYIGALRGLNRVIREDPISAIIVHGVHSPFLHAATRAGKAAGLPVIPILTDAPNGPAASRNLFVRWLRRWDVKLISNALREVDGVVALTTALAQDYAPRRPSLLLVGIAPALPPAACQSAASPSRVVYAGGLSPSYGVDLLINAVKESRGDWILEIFGRGELEGFVQEAARSDSRVVYGGVVLPEELIGVYSEADLLVNPRPPEQDLVGYSFPSKLLEYMATGRPVLSTHLPTIPGDFDPYLLYVQAEAGSIARTIDEFMTRSLESRDELGSSCRNFIVEHYGSKAQGERIVRFVSSLSAPDPVDTNSA